MGAQNEAHMGRNLIVTLGLGAGCRIGECDMRVMVDRHGYIAQWLERLTADQQVPGSNPGVPSFFVIKFLACVMAQAEGHMGIFALYHVCKKWRCARE